MKHALTAVAVAAACAFSSLAITAQSRPAQQVYAGVVDAKGEPVTGLGADVFRVREDGMTREVLSAGPATDPLTVAFLVDDSQATNAATQFIREAVETFIKSLDGKAEMSLVTFGERPTIAVDYTTDQKKLIDGGKRIFPRQGAGGYLMDAIVDVSRGFKKREKAPRKVIVVLMMDNSVEFSNHHYDNVLNELESGGAALHVITLGQPGNSLADETRNRDQVIAYGTERTGGRRDNVLALTSAAGRMKQLSQELQNQYVVSYARPETLIPPKKVEVTVTKPGLTVRARTRTGEAGTR